MTDALATRSAHIEVDPTPTGHVMLIAIGNDDDLDSMVIRLTPANAAKLGQKLIDAASKVELAGP
ncbi:MAG: hypothetical protein JOY55_06215 [Mycobacterium sp.]|nr:hypothetical protein [Mycobacterium sp.]MBV8291401.1 hypothetical protein [Mycobacterium sp.]